jgi:hypothetical protein
MQCQLLLVEAPTMVPAVCGTGTITQVYLIVGKEKMNVLWTKMKRTTSMRTGKNYRLFTMKEGTLLVVKLTGFIIDVVESRGRCF